MIALPSINTSSRSITTLRPHSKTHGRIKIHASEQLAVTAQSGAESTASKALGTIGRRRFGTLEYAQARNRKFYNLQPRGGLREVYCI